MVLATRQHTDNGTPPTPPAVGSSILMCCLYIGSAALQSFAPSLLTARMTSNASLQTTCIEHNKALCFPPIVCTEAAYWPPTGRNARPHSKLLKPHPCHLGPQQTLHIQYVHALCCCYPAGTAAGSEAQVEQAEALTCNHQCEQQSPATTID
jgi:hypothetical protein